MGGPRCKGTQWEFLFVSLRQEHPSIEARTNKSYEITPCGTIWRRRFLICFLGNLNSIFKFVTFSYDMFLSRPSLQSFWNTNFTIIISIAITILCQIFKTKYKKPKQKTGCRLILLNNCHFSNEICFDFITETTVL